MNDSPVLTMPAISPAPMPDNKGVHFERIAQTIPYAIKKAPVSRLESIINLKAALPDWYMNARDIDRQYLKQLIQERWRVQDPLDKTLGELQKDIKTFARPLLVNALKEKLGAELDVDETSLRLYVPDTIVFGIDTHASRLRQSTLLEAALHNFEEPETREGAFRSGSGVYTTDPEGAPELNEITAEQFAALCRDLDIGAQYQTHIKALLDPVTPQARTKLEQQSIASERAAFNASALAAHLKGDLTLHGYSCLQQFLDKKNGIQLYARPLQCHRLSLMGFRLAGIVLFSAVGDPSEIKKAVDSLTPDSLKFWMDWSERVPFLPGQEYERFKLLKAFFANGPQAVVDELIRKEDIYQQSRLSGPLIAYIPDDPEHPLKEYASFIDFMKELLSQLRSPDYQQFFSRFVAQKDKGRFFTRVNERLTTVTWQQREPLDMGPWWRETAVENPNAEPITNPVVGDLWKALYQGRRDKAIADARRIAVPTGDEDATTRWKRLTSYLDIAWNIFNFGAMLVPGLGEAMLGVMVAQMLEEFAEGIEDWSKGDKEEASAHINGVLINFAQLALMGAGHVLPGGAATPVKVSPFIDSLKPVEMSDGTTRLWKPDLGPYEHNVALPTDSRPSELGLHQHNGQDILPLDGKHYVVKEDPHTGKHRLQHPNRPTAYQPTLEHNGAGAWRSELELPIGWDGRTVLRRLGHSVESFSDATLEQIRIVSGVEEGVLRRMHVESEPPPALLDDTIRRFKAYADAGKLAEQIRNNQVGDELVGYLPTLITELPRWPEYKGIELFDGPELWGTSIKHGNASASNAHTLKITRAELMNGDLFERVVQSFDEEEVQAVLGRGISADPQARIEALQDRLAMLAQKQRPRLFKSLYEGRAATGDSQVALLQDYFVDLPTSVAKELLASAQSADVLKMTEQKQIPLRVKEQAFAAQREVRLTRAYEGLFLEGVENADSIKLALHTLEALPGWSDRIRIEIRESFAGELYHSIGPADAPVRKILVMDSDGKYEARDAENNHLHGADDLFASVLHALPDVERQTLNFEINQGAALKKVVQQTPLARDRFELILRDNPIRKPDYDPATMKLRGGMQGYRQIGGATFWEQTLRERINSLYPGFTQEEVEAFMTSLNTGGGFSDVPLKALEAEFNQLNSALQKWVNSSTQAFRFSPAGVAQWQSRNAIYKAIRQCWQRTGPGDFDVEGNYLGQKLDLDNFPMQQHLRDMPVLQANFDHVTSLSLRNTGLTSNEEFFLTPFRKLRFLDLAENDLTQFPESLGTMRRLKDLRLSNNRIELTALAVEHLRNLTRLEVLALGGNPLRLMPNIGRMPLLHTLLLGETGLDTWPTGLFSQPRFRHFHLDLQGNPIARIPDVAPGSFRAELLARTLISREPEWISPENLAIFKDYIESMGLDPDRSYPPLGVRDSLDWEEGLTRVQWVGKQELWNEVEDEIGSEAFFNEIRKLTTSADFTASDTSFRVDLTAKVWRMLEAMSQNTELREKLFTMATASSACADAGAQLFNAMGTEVLIHEAYALANKGLVEAELVTLAKGKSRLDSLGAIARARVAERLEAGERFRTVDEEGNVSGTIDEVEVHLTYMTDLAERLDLPWQSRGMLFRTIAKVSPEMIEAAYQRVLALEQGDLLRDSIVEQEFWSRYIRGANRRAFNDLGRKSEALIDLQAAQEKWANDASASVEEKARLREKIESLAGRMGKPLSDVPPGRVMTDEELYAALAGIDGQKTDLLKTLTQQAMNRARLQRTEIPFTVRSGS